MTRTFRLLVPVAALAACLVPALPAVAATATTTTVKSVTATVGKPVTLIAKVAPVPSSGTVAFSLDGTPISACSAAAVTASGKATCTTTFTTTAAHTVVARFGGGGTAAASSGQRVVKPVYGTRGTVVGSVGGCTTKSGALVAVSYGAWNGPIVRGCDTTPTTGIELLTTAGFTTTGTQHDGPQFICRIGHALWQAGAQYPTPATEACVATPPADAYWSYWLAPKGQNTWSYSPLGAYSDQPKRGEVEAWTFGATDIGGTTGQPSFTPAQIRAGLPTA